MLTPKAPSLREILCRRCGAWMTQQDDLTWRHTEADTICCIDPDTLEEVADPRAKMTMAEFRELNRVGGYHFFDRDTKLFFRSKIETDMLPGNRFVTSEQHVHSGGTEPRLYTVRQGNPNGTVSTVGEFQQYATRAAAIKAARA